MNGPGKVGHCEGCGDWRLIVDGRGRCFKCAAESQPLSPEAFQEQLREETVCRGCGQGKEVGTLVCWHCFKVRDNALKWSGTSVQDWLKAHGVLSDGREGR